MKNDGGYKGLVVLEANLEHFYLQEKRGIRLFPLSRVWSTLGLPPVAFDAPGSSCYLAVLGLLCFGVGGSGGSVRRRQPLALVRRCR